MIQRSILTTAMVLCTLALYCATGCDRGSPDTERRPESSASSDALAPSRNIAETRATLSQAGLPLSFVENKGQLDPAVRYVLRGPRGSVFFTPTEVVFEVFEREGVEMRKDTPDRSATDHPMQRRSVVVRVSFPGAQDDVTVEGRRELPGKVNIMRGNDPAKWYTDIRTFAEVVYHDLYPGIDLVFSGEKGELTRTFIVRPDGDIGNVRMKYAGVESVELTEDGAIRLKTAIGTIRERPPSAQRATGDTTVALALEPKLTGEAELSFTIGSN
jgi:hypothetical protein